MIEDEVIDYLDKTYEIDYTQREGIRVLLGGVGLDLFEVCTNITTFFSIPTNKATDLIISWLKIGGMIEPKLGWEVVFSGPKKLNTKWPTLEVERSLNTYHDIDGEAKIVRELCDKLKGELNDKYNGILSRSMGVSELLSFLNGIGYILGPYQDTPIKSRDKQTIIKKKLRKLG